ncbi:MAG: hypothetical protein DMG89_10000 [Acidobacteria bacterium]|nr:MAG: hypothetical protein DMG89_10000 [Acidobacteriota bacterium]
MNWIADRLRKQTDSKESGPQSVQRGYDSEARRLWSRFVQGFERDLDAYRQQKGNADLQRVSEFGCRVSNPAANTAVTVAADMSDQTIRYAYEPLAKATAVPEDGILTIRKAGRSLELYSADQKLTLEEARRLILEPLLFPTLPDDLEATVT